MEFRILGPLEVLDGGRPLPLPRGRGRALLAFLILHAGRVVHTERLLDALWGEAPPRTAKTALHGLVSSLRKRLEGADGRAPSVVRTATDGYTLSVDPVTVDAIRFRRLIDDARALSAPERSSTLRQALGLWRGPALADLAYQPFAQREIAALEELRLVALEERIEADIHLGAHHELVGEIQALVAEHPYRERLRGQLILALYRADRQADALEAYRRARRDLVEELGIEPGPALRDLEQAILRHDVSLDLEPRAEAAVAAASPDPTADEERWLAGERRIVTVLFVDLSPVGGEDPEILGRVADRSVEAAANVVRYHGGHVEELVGGMIVGLFGVPHAHEDDPIRAARAAVELRGCLPEEGGAHGVRVVVRAGLETGEVVVDAHDPKRPRPTGDAVTRAALLQQAAGDDVILVGPTARTLLDGAVSFDAAEHVSTPGAGAALPASRLADLTAPLSSVAPAFEMPFVGRTAELDRLRAVYDRTVRQRRGFRFTVLGEPGVGKSRLAAEFAAQLDAEARVLAGHCPSYGEGITFWPLREIVAATGVRDARALRGLLADHPEAGPIADAVASAVGLAADAGRATALFPAVRTLVESLAEDGPVVVVVEDIHWAQPTFLELIDFLATSVRAPVLILCLARPELIELRPAWGAGGRTADTLFLEPLDEEDTRRLMGARARALPDETRARIVDTSQGNPLFAEQLIASFQRDGLGTVPTTLRGLLAARLDRLGPGERDLLRCAAVIGVIFPAHGLEALLPDRVQPFVRSHLRSLEERRFIRVGSEPATYRFRHALIRLAAYRSTTRADRAALHERYADRLAVDPSITERDELLGYHLEQAVGNRRALGEEPDPALVVRAGEHLASAGMRAWTRYDTAAAANLMSRARALLPREHPRWKEAMQVLADAYPPLGMHEEADEVLAETIEHAAGQAEEVRAFRLKRARIHLDTRSADLDAIRAEAQEALIWFAASGARAEAAQAAHVLVNVLRVLGDTQAIRQVAPGALVHADRSGRLREELGLRYAIAWAAQAGDAPAVDAIEVCRDLAWRNGVLHPGILAEEAILRAMRGDADAARALIAEAKTHSVEVERVRRPLMFVIHKSAVVEALADDPVAAERELRTALEMALDMGEGDQLAHVSADLSLLLCALERTDEAGRFAEMCRAASPEGSVSQTRWRAARARVLASMDASEAERLAREAVILAPEPMLNLRADLLMDLVSVLRAHGGDADPVLEEAVSLYRRKGNLVAVARATRRS